MEMKELIFREKLIVLFRNVPADKLARTAEALADGGIRILELTFDHGAEDPIQTFTDSLQCIREAVGDHLRYGAGTVLTVEQVEAAHALGAEFIISPGTVSEVVTRTRELSMLSIPGAMTPTEIIVASRLGADFVKLFPADDLGYHYIQNIRGPLSHIPLLATGGVNPETIPEFLSRGISAVGTGISIVKRELLDTCDFAAITALAKEHVDAIRRATQQA